MNRPAAGRAMPVAVNFMLSQVGWFACVLGGANGWPWAGTLTALAIIALHLTFAAGPLDELKLLLAAALIGLLLDSLLIALGLTRYPSGTLIDGVAPHWLIALWMLFATTLNPCMGWLKRRLWLAALLGAIAGPIAFYGGHRLGGVQFAEPIYLSLAALALGWSAALPLLIAGARRWDGISAAAEPAPA